MTSIAIMIGGEVLNAAAFTCDNYLAKYIAGDNGQAALAEKTGHDKALEAYQAAMEKYTREHTKLLDWIKSNREIKDQAKQNFTNTDSAFKLYNQAQPEYKLTQPTEPKFSDMYQPSELQKQSELLFVGGGALALRYAAFVFFELFCLNKINGLQTRQNLLQPSGLLERHICHQKIGRSRKSA